MFQLLLLFLTLSSIYASNKDKPHGHKGSLEAYNGKPLPMKLTQDQITKLNKGEAVAYNERNGKSGRGVVIQDVNATTTICMGKIRDLPNYPKMVPHVKKVDIYENVKFFNGSSKVAAKFDIGLMGMGFGYFLLLTHEPKYNTLTWTLDYKKNSDFDDNVGHWQVMPHPSKNGWTRILYSTKIKLFPWIPEFIISFLTGKALLESTGWVKRESELENKKLLSLKQKDNDLTKMLPSWMNIKGGSLKIKNMITTKMSQTEKDILNKKQQFIHSMRSFPCPGIVNWLK